MRTIIPAIVAGLVISLAMPAFAGDASGTTAQPVAVAQPAAATTQVGEKQICRTMYHEGMLVRTQTCHTQAQWDQIRRAQERSVADFQNRNFTMSPK
jgi:hypothetical protein